MNWDDDIELKQEKKSSSGKGRRSSNKRTDSAESNVDPETPEVPIRTKRTGVWTEEGVKSSKGRTTNAIEDERFQTENVPASDEDDIPVIPDIEDLQDDPLNLPDVKPIVSVDKSTYKELDSQFETYQSDQISFGNLGDIDLSILTSRLYPEKEVQTVNEIWTMESLLDDLSKIA